MRIAVINFSGNVGKSLIARQLLKPRIPEAQYFPVETINNDESSDDVEPISAKEFSELNEYLLTVPSYIVDIGASNIEGVMEVMKEYQGSHNDFDHFIVPVVWEGKQQRDTISTINDLLAMGVPGSRIKVVFNRIKPSAKVENVFAPIFAYHKELKDSKKFGLNKLATVYESDAFFRARSAKKTISELVNDQTDYRELLSTIPETDTEKRAEIAKIMMAQRTAFSANENFDTVFKALFKK